MNGEPPTRLSRWSQSGQWFTTTHWSVVLAAKDSESPEARSALEQLCRTYWPCVYTYIRRQGHAPADAQDLTQGFFARLCEKDYLHHLRHQQGRFRSFLLTFVKHFLADERDKAKAQKRGGGRVFLSLNDTQHEERSWLAPKDERDPERLFEKRWAHAVLEQAVQALHREYAAEGKEALFDQMKGFQPGQRGERSYADAAAPLGMTETAFKSAIHRMRQRYRQTLREVIAQTVATPAEVDDEIRHFLSVLAD